MMLTMIEIDTRPLRAFLVGPWEEDEREASASLFELAALAENLGWICAGSELVYVRQKNPAFYTGSGKAEEIKQAAIHSEADLIAFDIELSPSQQRNWEKLSGLPVADRPGIIIDIFADRAQTREAQLQVELAELEYQLPRLSASYTGLSRQRGGIYGTKGSGETKIELDRRVIRNRVAYVRRELAVIRSRREILRSRRQRRHVPVVALVGYTNAGKSSLMKALTGAEVLVRDALFATLDPTSRKIELPNSPDSVMIDTVGFIRNLPHRLIEAFKATLEELLQADLLVHVLDASDPDIVAQHKTTLEVLAEIGAADKPSVLVLNKIDLLVDSEDKSVIEQRERIGFRFGKITRVSAVSGTGLDDLRAMLALKLNGLESIWEVTIPWERSDLLAAVHRTTRIVEQIKLEDGIVIRAAMNERIRTQLRDAGLEAEPISDEIR